MNDWIFPSIPSLSDHPIITFSAFTVTNQSVRPTQAQKSLLCPTRCNIEHCRFNLSSFLSNLPSLTAISTLSNTEELENFWNSLLDTLKHAINNSRLPFDRSKVPGKMPWWSKQLWSHRHKLRLAYKAKTSMPSAENLASYKSLKTSYQRLLRQAKSDHWKVFCTAELNKDLYGGLKSF